MVVFIMISVVYNSPVISGKNAIYQPDIINYKGSAQQMQAHEKATGEQTYWSDAMFGGMPTYQTGAKYPNHWIKKVDEVIRFLPRPADYMFLTFAGFFILGIVLFRNWKYALLGACLFAMGTYFFQLYDAGHNSKIHVKVGQRIKRGEKIAAVGNTGRSTGSHVHYEVRRNNVPLNPKKYI